MISIEHLTKSYGGFTAVEDLCFTLEKGYIYGFLGPNGAGKSTTMNMISGYLAPTDGKVIINDIDMLKNPEKAKKHIGYLPEVPPLYGDMTITEYLFFVAELKFISKIQIKKQVETVVTKTKLDEVKDRLIKNLSKGYKQRVGLAAALLGNPELLILDEPTAGLDPKQITEIRQLLKDIKDDHIILLSTHILTEAAEVCDKMIIISKGQVMANGSQQELLSKYNEGCKIKLTVNTSVENMKTIMDSFSNSLKYTVYDENNCSSSYVINANEDLSINLSKKIQEAGYCIYELTKEYMSLEDIYLKLTNGDYFSEFTNIGTINSTVNEASELDNNYITKAEFEESNNDITNESEE